MQMNLVNNVSLQTKKKKSTATFSIFFLKRFIKKVNLNNKYPKIIKHLLDKIKGILDAKSIFRLKGSSRSVFLWNSYSDNLHRIDRKVRYMESFFQDGFTWMVFYRKGYSAGRLCPFILLRKNKSSFLKLNCFSWGVNLFLHKYFNVHFCFIEKIFKCSNGKFSNVVP